MRNATGAAALAIYIRQMLAFRVTGHIVVARCMHSERFCFLAARKMTTRDYSDTVIAISGKAQSLGKEAKHGQWENHVGK